MKKAGKTAKKTGRPSDYEYKIAIEICRRLSEGQSLVTICKDEDMPSTSAVYRWLFAEAQFRDIYAQAREWQADTLADETLTIPDDLFNSRAEMSAAQLKSEVELARLRFDARKWAASKLKPKKYGDKLIDDDKDKKDVDANLSESERIAKAMAIFDAARKRADSEPRSGD